MRPPNPIQTARGSLLVELVPAARHARRQRESITRVLRHCHRAAGVAKILANHRRGMPRRSDAGPSRNLCRPISRCDLLTLAGSGWRLQHACSVCHVCRRIAGILVPAPARASRPAAGGIPATHRHHGLSPSRRRSHIERGGVRRDAALANRRAACGVAARCTTR
jgi:hypothetical protein